MKNSQKSSGGYWMIFGIVALLAMPMVVDHFVNAPAPELHADASPVTN